MSISSIVSSAERILEVYNRVVITYCFQEFIVFFFIAHKIILESSFRL